MSRAGRATPFGGWGAVLVLVIAYAISFVDRQVVALLVEPLKADLRLTDSQIGLVQGPAFGLFYALLGFPLGWLADRTHRVRLIVAGVLLWSAMTAASGLATGFTALFLARVGVGVGEAALVPAAISLLADLFRPERRALPMSVFTAGVALGVGLALVLGGLFVTAATSGLQGAPLIGGWLARQATWRVVFFMAGALGLPIAVAILGLSEPARAAAAASAEHPRGVGYLWAERRLYVPLLLGAGLLYIFTNALAGWAPTLFIRTFHWSSAQAGLRLGAIIMPCAILGNVFSGVMATWLARGRRLDAPLRTMLIGATLLAPLAVLAPLAPSPGLALVGIAGLYLGISLTFGVATTAFVAITPAPLRGRVVAIYLLVGNLLGLGIGPYLVGLMLDHGLFGHVGVALSIVGLVSVAPGLLLMRSVRGRYGVGALAVDSAARVAAKGQGRAAHSSAATANSPAPP